MNGACSKKLSGVTPEPTIKGRSPHPRRIRASFLTIVKNNLESEFRISGTEKRQDMIEVGFKLHSMKLCNAYKTSQEENEATQPCVCGYKESIVSMSVDENSSFQTFQYMRMCVVRVPAAVIT